MENEVTDKKVKRKVLSSVLALLIGTLGIHRFYLGQWWGIFYILFAITGIPFVVSFIEGNIYLFGSDEKWDKKYGLKSKTTNTAKAIVFILLVLPTLLLIGLTTSDAYNEYEIKVAEKNQANQI